MPLLELPLDIVGILVVPLMIMTAVQARKQWGSLWDDDLTAEDRSLMQRLVLFWLVPVVVLFHELGHCMAIWAFGGTVQEFHYALIWGYVVPSGHFTGAELVWTYFSGNLVQILIGLAALAAAMRCHSPPAVALCIYLFFWSAGGTAVIYALLSATGLYGDWINIYLSPVPSLTIPIALFHAATVALLIWCAYSEKARLWYASRTQPRWFEQHKELERKLCERPTAEHRLGFGWSLYQAGLFSAARECLHGLSAEEARLPEAVLLSGALEFRKGNTVAAMGHFSGLTQRGDVAPSVRARAHMALANCHLRRREPDAALAEYDRAASAQPGLADPLCMRALLLSDLNRGSEARDLLERCAHLEWRDQSLKQAAEEALRALAEAAAADK